MTSTQHHSFAHVSINAPAMLLAAGRGERMRPLTDNCPKPLLTVKGQCLMQWHLQALSQVGVPRVVINTAWLGEQIERLFGDHFPTTGMTPASRSVLSARPMPLHYSREGLDFGRALETAGGISRALPLLLPASSQESASVFWVLAGDVFAPGFEFSAEAARRFAASGKLAHLWLVGNPPHHPRGDFGLSQKPDILPDNVSTGLSLALDLPVHDGAPRYTYSTIGLFHRSLFEPPWCDMAVGNPEGCAAALAPLLRSAMQHGMVSAELYEGAWTDVGTPARLAALNIP